jgi:hypothetical protein
MLQRPSHGTSQHDASSSGKPCSALAVGRLLHAAQGHGAAAELTSQQTAAFIIQPNDAADNLSFNVNK